MDEGRVAPGLLLAMPQLSDPNFFRSVVLMVEHTDEGSFGLVVNRPSAMPVGALLKALEVDWRGDPEAVVWGGGPVMPTTGWVLHQPLGEIGPGTVEIAPGIALSTSPDVLRQIAGRPPAHLRFLLGYSGWGPGQLASEMERGSWLYADATPELVFATSAEEMWATALGTLGVAAQDIVHTRGVN